MYFFSVECICELEINFLFYLVNKRESNTVSSKFNSLALAVNFLRVLTPIYNYFLKFILSYAWSSESFLTWCLFLLFFVSTNTAPIANFNSNNNNSCIIFSSHFFNYEWLIQCCLALTYISILPFCNKTMWCTNRYLHVEYQ